MSHEVPLAAGAVATLYPADPNGEPITDAAVWFGACLNGGRMTQQFTYAEIPVTAARGPRQVAVGSSWQVELERVWLLEGTSLADFNPGLGERFALELSWNLEGTNRWFRRLFKDVTLESRGLVSNGALEFAETQSFQAGDHEDTDGSGLVIPIRLGDDFGQVPVGFYYENPLEVSEYFLGHYAWEQPVTLVSAKAIAKAPTGTVTCALEVDGVLTGLTLTIPSGAAGSEVEVTANLNDYALAAGQEVRWQVTNAPALASSASGCAIIMQVAST